MKLITVVLSGGAGTRLWPASRLTSPKPFMKLGGRTLLEQAIARGQACGSDDLLVVTNQDHLFLTQRLLADMDDPPKPHYILEPKGRNTAPAIALAALHCLDWHGPDAVMLVLPADQLIPDTRTFVVDALDASRHALEGKLVVFGIQPTGPETGFGYVEVAEISRHAQPVLQFVEKPSLMNAQNYLATGRFYWNSGMFCFTAQAAISALATHCPDVLDAARAVMRTRQPSTLPVTGSVSGASVSRFDAHTFGLQPDISIDYALMERARDVMLVPARFTWSDVGTWPAVAQAHTPDTVGNTLGSHDKVQWVAMNTTGTHVHIEGHDPKVVATVGLRDVVIVDTPDALLVASKHDAQHVKQVVEKLRDGNTEGALHQSTLRPTLEQHPWGSSAILNEDQGYKVKRLTVRSGQSLSLQFHHKRAEHWVVVQGKAMIQIGDESCTASAGDYRFIPVREHHRLSNVGEDDLVLIEVQCGASLSEDDIVRLVDNYGRA